MARHLLFTIQGPDYSLEWRGPASPTTWSDDGHAPVGLLRVRASSETRVQWTGGDRDGTDLDRDDGPPLHEYGTYQVMLRSTSSNATVALRHRDAVLVGDLAASDDGRLCHGPVGFKGHVGLSRFEIVVDGRAVATFEVEVVPTRLDYRADYDAMLAACRDILVGLVLDWLSPTWTRGQLDLDPERKATHLEWVTVLEQLMSRIEQALTRVAARPRRSMRSATRWQRAGRIRRTDSRVRNAVRTGRGRGTPMDLGDGVVVRQRLEAPTSTTTLDTPEHRWLATRLRAVRRRLARLAAEERERVGTGRHQGKRSRVRLDTVGTLERRVGTLLRLEPLQAANGEPPPGFSSQQLLRAPGYREAALCLLALEQGLSLRGESLELSVRDVATLYEMWCFLAVIDRTRDLPGVQLVEQDLIRTEARGFRVRLIKGQASGVTLQLGEGRLLRIAYNEGFTREVLFTQIPDVTLTLEDERWPRAVLVADAKYRLDASEEAIQRYGGPVPPQDALGELHRYRDAILSDAREDSTRDRLVVQAVALYPWRPRDAAVEGFRDGQMWQYLQRYGVGAVPMLPSDLTWLDQWLQTALGGHPWSHAERQPSGSNRRVRDAWLTMAEESVLVGGLRSGGAAEHLAWCLAERRYHVPHRPGQPRQLRARYIALYEPAETTDTGQGLVRWVAPVRAVEIIPREAVSTPWTTQDPARLVVSYSLGDWEMLSQPVHWIPGQTGGRIGAGRWTSRLALERARSVEELCIESVAEWQIFDLLRARGVELDLRAATVPGAQSSGFGHAVFGLPDGAVLRWHAGDGFVMEAKDGTRRRTSSLGDVDGWVGPAATG